MTSPQRYVTSANAYSLTLGVIGVVPTLPRIVCDVFRCQRGQNDAYVGLKLSPDETESGNRSVGTEIDPRYTTSSSTSVDNIGLSRAVLPKTNYVRSGRIRNCTHNMHRSSLQATWMTFRAIWRS